MSIYESVHYGKSEWDNVKFKNSVRTFSYLTDTNSTMENKTFTFQAEIGSDIVCRGCVACESL